MAGKTREALKTLMPGGEAAGVLRSMLQPKQKPQPSNPAMRKHPRDPNRR